jgi:hypothetical protein
MPWFEFRQNNSGGRLVIDEQVALYVYVEADGPASANARAELVGVYFEGCRDGRDCDCCGDRWSEQEAGTPDIPPPSDWRPGPGYTTGAWVWSDAPPPGWAERDRQWDTRVTAVAHGLDGRRRYGLPAWPDAGDPT